MRKPFKDHVATLEVQLDVSQAHLDNERLARIEIEVEAARLVGKLDEIENRRPQRKFLG